ncbi:MAG: hypothetical protein NVSMB49_27830 [Ktedonobacteraceae bacterium]
MNEINRRRFLQLAGAGSVAAATAGAAAVAPALQAVPQLAASKDSALAFRATVGLPTKPMPAYASYVIEGHVNLATRSGFVTKTVLAGSPDTPSTIALPGLSRIIRVTDVQDQGNVIYIKGTVDDRSLLQHRESPYFEMYLDRANGIVRSDFFGSQVQLLLEKN